MCPWRCSFAFFLNVTIDLLKFSRTDLYTELVTELFIDLLIDVL